MMNARTHEQKQLTSMVVNLMDKVDALMKKQDEVQSISDSEDTFGVTEKAIRKQHLHDRALEAKKVKKCAKAKSGVHTGKQLAASVKERRKGKGDKKAASEERHTPSKSPKGRRWGRLALGNGRFDGFL